MSLFVSKRVYMLSTKINVIRLTDLINMFAVAHLKKLKMALKMIKYPTDREVAIIKAKSAIDALDKHSMADSQDRKLKLEYDFWIRLQDKGLRPESEEYKEVCR